MKDGPVPAPADARSETATVVDFGCHPEVRRRRLLRQARELRRQCAAASREAAALQAALEAFGRRIEEHRARLAPVRADTAATLKAIAGGDVAEMKRVRDEILRRLQG